ncbi:hypothetical protein JOM56_011451 [Amanita muscaria]
MSARDQIYTHLQAALLRVLGEAIQGVDLFPKGELSLQRFQKPRMRVQVLLRQLTDQAKEATAQADQSALTEIEINRCSALIACAFLDPYKVLWDSDRFAEASKKRRTGKYFGETHLGIFAKPATIVDTQGKILAWYLPGLLLSHQIALLNGATRSIKDTVLNSLNKQTTSWRTKGYVIPDEYDEPSKAYFGAGKLSISLGTFMTGHMVQTWLQTIQPVELLLDATLQIIHPDFWHATFTASQALAQQLQFPIPCWPSVSCFQVFLSTKHLKMLLSNVEWYNEGNQIKTLLSAETGSLAQFTSSSAQQVHNVKVGEEQKLLLSVKLQAGLPL